MLQGQERVVKAMCTFCMHKVGRALFFVFMWTTVFEQLLLIYCRRFIRYIRKDNRVQKTMCVDFVASVFRTKMAEDFAFLVEKEKQNII